MDCITFTENGEEADLRTRLRAPAKNVTQDLYVANDLKTDRVMVKDEDVCLHCGLCAERCPTGAWDMKKNLIDMTHANDQGRVAARSQASTTWSSGSRTSTAPAPPAPTSCSRARCCAWAFRSRRATFSRPTSRACRPGTRCASRKPATLARVAAPISWWP